MSPETFEIYEDEADKENMDPRLADVASYRHVPLSPPPVPEQLNQAVNAARQESVSSAAVPVQSDETDDIASRNSSSLASPTGQPDEADVTTRQEPSRLISLHERPNRAPTVDPQGSMVSPQDLTVNPQNLMLNAEDPTLLSDQEGVMDVDDDLLISRWLNTSSIPFGADDSGDMQDVAFAEDLGLATLNPSGISSAFEPSHKEEANILAPVSGPQASPIEISSTSSLESSPEVEAPNPEVTLTFLRSGYEDLTGLPMGDEFANLRENENAALEDWRMDLDGLELRLFPSPTRIPSPTLTPPHQNLSSSLEEGTVESPLTDMSSEMGEFMETDGLMDMDEEVESEEPSETAEGPRMEESSEAKELPERRQSPELEDTIVLSSLPSTARKGPRMSGKGSFRYKARKGPRKAPLNREPSLSPSSSSSLSSLSSTPSPPSSLADTSELDSRGEDGENEEEYEEEEDEDEEVYQEDSEEEEDEDYDDDDSDPDNSGSLRCRWGDCNVSRATPNDLYDHVISRHVGRQPTKLSTPKFCAWRGCNLHLSCNSRRHRLTIHIPTHLRDDCKPFACEVCGEMFHSFPRKVMHRKENHP